MLKFVFWALLFLNGVLFAYGQGYLGKFNGGEREPARVKNQLAADKLKLVPPEQAQVAAASAPQSSAEAAPATPATSAADAAPAVACTEIGPFAPGEVRRFESRLARLDLGERMTQVSVPFQEVTSRLVYIPPQGSREAAERKAAELRNLGVTNLFIIPGDTPLRNGISLGLFKSEASAQALLAQLNKQGVRGARVAPRGPMTTRTSFQFRGIDAATRDDVVEIAQRVGAAQVKNCR